MDDVESLAAEAANFALFNFALFVCQVLPPPHGIDKKTPDEQLAREAIREAIKAGCTNFDAALWGTRGNIERRYAGAPSAIQSSAMERVRRVLREEQGKT
ncbi:MAG: hypothetical protein BGN87_06305 [Rhizobiales bacterium 65-79]|jgi:hypothetical protein|nr:hypothetical protein [Hyphomicrobiales bacterium]OJU02802.1 MAG: hypothetical protein BGN87_06305 [Rhizobiales bacterium 65-79]